jgi:hypothetical protein
VAGISCDPEVNVKTLPITIHKFQKVYVPADGFITADPLPQCWMELFDEEVGRITVKEEIFDSSGELEAAYDP